ncbi:hypothetical protein [Megasphaera vaginalis (ex Srinivasan et al. 2021)]|uniref:Uncharacterized protein n=1 Tax=Megasphaera vaginalis (ex Srinivasan et al. 2021) TaxID=1111454 RepID=U7UV87_9FIRM|nr:hypothetical protein [Megasphaera vaginalis (ex Srinivasan et al. 2021)]ERT62383.1 hypothetical protein HMPREF1250_0243 [Megasphaera vaginalis (ex Srinivasan et al. 2021)]
MNRKQRRDLLKSKNGEKLIELYTQDMRRAAVQHTTEFALEYFRTQLALALHDEYGFGKSRIQKVIRRMDGYSQSDSIGDVGYEELREFVKSELALDFREGDLLGEVVANG